jgi:hypothetical protein
VNASSPGRGYLWLSCSLLVLVLSAAFRTERAEAIPVFAHRYGLTCQTCHSVVPRLNSYGQAFLERGYRLPGLPQKGTFPVSLRTEFAYSSQSGGDEGGGPLPKVIVDEVELLSGASLSPRFSYWAEQYIVDGGFPGQTRDAYLQYWATDPAKHVPILIRGGQFTLPLPLDPETFRETTDHYAIWDQTAGFNPFNFFAPKMGAEAIIGNQSAGTSASIALLQGHEPQSGIPSHGLDRMLYVQHAMGDWTFSAYRYEGTRVIDDTWDHFWRQGYGLIFQRKKVEVDGVYQIGNDSSADIFGDSLISSGGFVQFRYGFSNRFFGIARWDATYGAQFLRAWTGGFGYGVTKNSRLTVFDSIQFNEDLGRYIHVPSASLLIAF